MLNVRYRAIAMLCRIMFVASLEILSCWIDGAKVTEDGGLLLERVGDGGATAAADLELLEGVQHPRLLHLIGELDEGEGGGLGIGGGFAGDNAFDLVEPSNTVEVGSGGDGSREEEADARGVEKSLKRASRAHLSIYRRAFRLLLHGFSRLFYFFLLRLRILLWFRNTAGSDPE